MEQKIEILSKHFLMDKTRLQECVISVSNKLKLSSKKVIKVLGKNNRRIEMKRVLIPDVLRIIDDYRLKYKLRFPELFKNKKNKLWIDHLKTEKDIKTFWSQLSQNPNAITILEANQDKINWQFLSKNPNAIDLIEANLSKIDWYHLSGNPNAIRLIEANPSRVVFSQLSKNPNAIHLLEANLNLIDWDELSENPNAIHLLEANPSKINWKRLSKNPNAIKLLTANQDELLDWGEIYANPNAIEFLTIQRGQIILGSTRKSLAELQKEHEGLKLPYHLAMNTNPIAIEMLKANPWSDKLSLNRNPDAIDLLLETVWRGRTLSNDAKANLWANPAIFQEDKENGFLNDLMNNEKYYVVYNTKTNNEEKTFNTLKEAQEYAMFL